MKLQLVVSLLAVLALSAGSAFAQEKAPKVDIFAGYSYLQANPGVAGVDAFHLNGGSASLAYNFRTSLSAVADFGGYNNGNVLGRGNGTVSSYLFGPRYSFRHFRKITPFGQVLVGTAHADANAFRTAGTQNAFAMTAGGGVDYKLFDHISIRPFQTEYLLTRFREGTLATRNENNLRVSTGFVFRF